MLSRAAARALPRASTLSARTSAVRTISTTARACSDGHPVVPKIYGPGSKPGEMPSLLDQATGLERLQLLGDIEGFEAFDRSPLDASRIGTKKEPIVVLSHDPERLVGCTGFPADSHEVLWFPVQAGKQHRCVECGSVYALDYEPAQHSHDEHAHH